MKTKLLFFMLTMALSIGFASAESGTCGENLTWDLTDGVLTISGTGEMTNFVSNAAPWYSSRSTITTVNIGNGVTSIGNSAFYECSSLTSVTIPNSVTSIGYSAFYNCSSLTSVAIGNSVTSIGNSAFYNCSSLTGVYITDLTAWCKIEFDYSSSNPLYYAHNLYLNGTLVTDLIIPNSVTSIGSYAFSRCSSLTSVTIPNSVTSIGSDAFYNCFCWKGVYITDLTAWCNIKFGNGLSNPLYNAHNLYLNGNLVTDLIIPNSVTSIGSFAFYDCSSLTSVTIPNGVTSIGGSAFERCSSLKRVYITDLTAWCNLKFGNGLSNPLYNAHNLYLNGTLVTDLTIPDGVTSINSCAFYGCSSLTSVTIPNSVTSIGGLAFYGCSSLTSVTIPNSVTSIGSSAFEDCSSLTGVYITDLTAWCNIKFGNGGSSNPLYYAHNLYLNGNLVTDLIIPNSVTSIGNAAFFNCSSLTSVTIPNSVTSIGSHAFNNCSSLASVTIPNSVTSIGSYAFYNCSSLTGVYITDLTAWCKIVFGDSYANPLEYAHNLYLNGNLVTDLIIPNSITSIGYDAFSGCSSLTLVTIHNSVTSIGSYAFSHCSSLTSVTIPNSVTSIGYDAFSECSSLKSVTIEATTPPGVYKSSFPQNQIVYVPLGSLAAYKKITWKYFDLRVFDVTATKSESMPTSINISFGNNTTRELIASCGIEGGETFEGNIVEYIGLEPESKYEDVPFFVKTTKDDYMTTTLSFTTSALTLTTQPAKPVSANTAILLAETNMADIETSCGFEYKRNDAPADMEGNKVLCPVANGQMAGRLKGLKDDVYYKYRAFYKSSAGNMYYGDWQYIFTGDVAVEFDPVLYTYEASNVQETQARLRGYALAGSDDFTEQGFEYWADSRTTPTNIIARSPQATLETIGEHHTIQANGISMSVNLNNLDAGTTYRYRTYAKIGSQTLYGAEMSFTTKGEYTPPTYTITFVNYDNSPLLTLTNVEQGTLPVYTGDTPTRDDDDEYTYTFRGWQPEIVAAEADATYTATYNAAKRTDAIDIISADENSVGPRKIIENGRLYIILPNGKKYTATGEEVR